MLQGGKYGHIHANFRNNANSGKELDTRSRHNKIKLRKVLLGNRQNQRIKIEFALFEAVHVGTDDAELFSLLGTHLSVHSGKDFLISRFHALGAETGNIGDFLGWLFKKPGRDCGSSFSKCIGKHVTLFDIGNSQAVLCSVFPTGGGVGEFPAIPHQIQKLLDVCWRDKTA